MCGEPNEKPGLVPIANPQPDLTIAWTPRPDDLRACGEPAPPTEGCSGIEPD